MSWVDIVIIVVVLLAGLRGFAEGAISQIAVIIGLGVGFYLGTSVAPSLSDDITTGHGRPVLALIILLVSSPSWASLGGIVGRILSRFVSALMLGIVDRVVGVAVGVVAALVLCWLFAGILAERRRGSVDSAIQNSAILSALDHVMPPVPSVESQFNPSFKKLVCRRSSPTSSRPPCPLRSIPDTPPPVIH